MKSYDWIVIGAGITGAALSYALIKQGFSVLLVEQDPSLQGATRYSYGGLALWAGKTPMMQQLSAEGWNRYQSLPTELDADIQLRELDLLLTISPGQDPVAVAASYADCAIPPQLIDSAEALKMEPLLDPAAIGGALKGRHGHIHPEKTAQAFGEAFKRKGGEILITPVQALLQSGSRILGIQTPTGDYQAAQVIVCAGGFSRSLLKAAGIKVRHYYTHAESLEITPVSQRLQTMLMPAQLQRFELEAKSTTAELDPLWDQPGGELVPAIFDRGIIQFQDGSLRLGQFSRILTDPYATTDPVESELQIRQQVREILPDLADYPGSVTHSLVAFSHDQLPLVGEIPGWQGVQIFSGFSNPLVVIPVIAERFAQHLNGSEDEWIPMLSPSRLAAPGVS